MCVCLCVSEWSNHASPCDALFGFKARLCDVSPDSVCLARCSYQDVETQLINSLPGFYLFIYFHQENDSTQAQLQSPLVPRRNENVINSPFQISKHTAAYILLRTHTHPYTHRVLWPEGESGTWCLDTTLTQDDWWQHPDISIIVLPCSLDNLSLRRNLPVTHIFMSGEFSRVLQAN